MLGDDLITEMTEQYDIHDLFAMTDLNEDATDKEIKAKTECIILSYLRAHNQDRANFFQEVQRRLLEQAVGTTAAPADHPVEPPPIHRTLRAQLVSIHSQFRSNYYDQPSTDYVFELPTPMRNVASIGVAAVEIPRLYNTISAVIGNSAMVVSGAAGSAWLVTIPDGNYDTPLALVDDCFDKNVAAVNAAIGAALPGELVNDAFVPSGASDSLTAEDLTYSVDPLTHKSVFTSASGKIDGVRFNVDKEGALDASKVEKFGLGSALGFRYGARSFDTSLTAEGVAFLSGPSYWFVSIEDFLSVPHSEPFVVAYNGWNSTKSILSRVSVAHDSERRIIRTHLSQPRKYKGTADVQKLRIQLLDEYGRPVDLNSMDWSVVLQFETLEVGWDCD